MSLRIGFLINVAPSSKCIRISIVELRLDFPYCENGTHKEWQECSNSATAWFAWS